MIRRSTIFISLVVSLVLLNSCESTPKAHSEISTPPGAKDSTEEVATPSVMLREGNNCSQDKKLILGNYPTIPGWNDEARSLEDLSTGPGTFVTVYDSHNFRTNDDFAVIIVDRPGKVCVSTFEVSPVRDWVRGNGYRIWYSGGNRLDGKVSSVRFGRWW